MSETVVDPLELVEVDKAQRERRVFRFRSNELALETLVEAAVVAESGVDEAAQDDPSYEDARRVAVHVLDGDPGGERREREHRGVVGDPERRPPAEREGDGGGAGGDEHARGPTEQDD